MNCVYATGVHKAGAENQSTLIDKAPRFSPPELIIMLYNVFQDKGNSRHTCMFLTRVYLNIM